MLERIALHHTRLHTPGLGVDAKGVALGTKGLILVPSIDRLVALLSAYTREHSLGDVLPSLSMQVARSKLGTTEITLEFAAESSDRMDRLADMARLVGGYTFTGTSRHFVQYRDAAAPFGYDARELLSTSAALALYSDRFSQTYDYERRIDLRALLLRLSPVAEPSMRAEAGPRIVVAEQGLGPAIVHYFVRSRVEGDVCVAEWPAETSFDEGIVRRWILRIPELPDRMRRLVQTTPGLACFVLKGPGVAVEAGHRHPIELRSCPVFDPAGLALLRGRGQTPWIIERLPAMGSLSSIGRVELRGGAEDAATAEKAIAADAVRVPLRVLGSSASPRSVTAACIPVAQWPLLRRLAYCLPRAAIAETRLAVTDRGLYLRCKSGIEAVPLGMFFSEVHPDLYVPAGFEVTPAVAPEVLARALDARAGLVLFIGTDARAVGIEATAFSPLEAALLAAQPWEPVVAKAIEQSLDEPLVELKTTSVGLRPLRGVDPAPDAGP